MNILMITYGHPDNVFSLTKQLGQKVKLTLLFIVSGNLYEQGVMSIDISRLKYGLNDDVEYNRSILPEAIQNFLGHSVELLFLRTPHKKVFLDYRFKNYKLFKRAFVSLKKGNFDLVHINGTSGFILFTTCLLRKYKKIWTLHDYKAHSGERNIKTYIINRYVSKKMDYIVQHYEYLKKQLIVDYKLPLRKVWTIYSGSLDVFSSFKSNNPGINERNYILFFGRISAYKGVDVLLKAYKMLDIEHDIPKLVIAGAGQYNILEENKNIIYLNRYIATEELVFLIKNSAVVVVPYKDATHSAVIATAYAFNKPVIASDVGGINEVVLHMETGLLTEPSNTIALVEAIRKYFRDEDLKLSFENKIQDLKTKGHLSWTEIIEKYKKLYLKALAD